MDLLPCVSNFSCTCLYIPHTSLDILTYFDLSSISLPTPFTDRKTQDCFLLYFLLFHVCASIRSILLSAKCIISLSKTLRQFLMKMFSIEEFDMSLLRFIQRYRYAAAYVRIKQKSSVQIKLPI